MIFAIPAAVQGATIATKILVAILIIAALLGLGFAAGKHWEVGNTLAVQLEYDKFVNNVKEAGNKQETKTKLENQRLLKDKEIADEQNLRARDSLVAFADELQRLKQKGFRASVMPRPTANDSGSGLTCFDGAELIAADDRYREGEAERRGRIYAIVEEGAKNTADLDSAKLWRQKLPVTQFSN